MCLLMYGCVCMCVCMPHFIHMCMSACLDLYVCVCVCVCVSEGILSSYVSGLTWWQNLLHCPTFRDTSLHQVRAASLYKPHTPWGHVTHRGSLHHMRCYCSFCLLFHGQCGMYSTTGQCGIYSTVRQVSVACTVRQVSVAYTVQYDRSVWHVQ